VVQGQWAQKRSKFGKEDFRNDRFKVIEKLKSEGKGGKYQRYKFWIYQEEKIMRMDEPSQG
jgi:hypothetical protein